MESIWREEIVFHQTLSQGEDWSMFGEPKKEKEKGMFGWNTKEVKRRENKGLIRHSIDQLTGSFSYIIKAVGSRQENYSELAVHLE